jgi:hypothetical protein
MCKTTRVLYLHRDCCRGLHVDQRRVWSVAGWFADVFVSLTNDAPKLLVVQGGFFSFLSSVVLLFCLARSAQHSPQHAGSPHSASLERTRWSVQQTTCRTRRVSYQSQCDQKRSSAGVYRYGEPFFQPPSQDAMRKHCAALLYWRV